MRFVALSLLAGCEPAATYVPSPVPAIVASVAQQAQLIAHVADAARDYQAWPRVDNVLRAAPIPCAAGDLQSPRAASRPSVSAATDGEHARKLFYLRTTNAEAYANDEPVPAGFVIVKETFASEPIATRPRADCDTRTGPYCMHASDTVNVDGTELRAGSLTGLFVMAKVAELTGTDEHWIYGTVTTDGVVKSVGRIPSCMACHEDAAHERLFGVN